MKNCKCKKPTQKVAMTKRSTNMIKEYRSYMWKTEKTGVETSDGVLDYGIEIYGWKIK